MYYLYVYTLYVYVHNETYLQRYFKFQSKISLPFYIEFGDTGGKPTTVSSIYAEMSFKA